MTTDQARPVTVGDTIHTLAPLIAFGDVLPRGATITLTAEQVESTIDLKGNSWLDDVSENAQIRRWGEPRFGLGSFPADLDPWLPGSPEAAQAREEARLRAWRREDPEERSQALQEVARRFGPAPTSRTLNSAPDPSVRAEREQRNRLDKGGLRCTSNYTPTERA